MTRWSLFLQTLSLLHHFLGLYFRPAALQQTDTSGFQVVSAKFSEIRPKTRIPLENSCYGENLSPPLSWDEAPEGTRSLALIADEPENELGPWVHWVVYNIPAGVTELPPARGTLKKCVNSQAVYPLSEQHGLEAQERRYTAHEEGKH